MRNTTDARKILSFLESGSVELEEEIKRIEQDKKESPIRRVAPVGTAWINTLSSTAAGGGKQAGGEVLSDRAKQLYF